MARLRVLSLIHCWRGGSSGGRIRAEDSGRQPRTAEDNEEVSELLPDRTSDERDDLEDEQDERQRDRDLEEERPPHHEPR